jgi:hypothetical protein
MSYRRLVPRAIAEELAKLAKMAAAGELERGERDEARAMVLAGAPAAAATEQAIVVVARAAADRRSTRERQTPPIPLEACS